MFEGFHRRRNQGAMLIIALWSLGFLAIFALMLSAIVRQKIELLSRLENRNKVHLVAEGGVKKAIALLKRDLEINARLSALSKAHWYNNPNDFKNIPLGDGFYDVRYSYGDMGMKSPHERYGFTDEESKININKVSAAILKNLIKNIFNWADIDASKLANAIVDWREYGESEISGFFSDEYYENLKYPYLPKKGEFEVLEELLLVKGVNEAIFEGLLPFVTIYGDGQVNVNTASRAVLLALGIKEETADLILSVRRGPDGIEATADDYIFQNQFSFPIDLLKMANLKFPDIEELELFSRQGKVGVESVYYRVESRAALSSTKEVDVIRCIFNIKENKVEDWREQYKGRME